VALRRTLLAVRTKPSDEDLHLGMESQMKEKEKEGRRVTGACARYIMRSTEVR
jgi:hypothetical protein